MLSRIKLSHLAAIVASLLAIACSPATTADAQGITVSGNAFIRNGAPWVPQGFSLVGRVAPRGRSISGTFDRAHDLYGPRLFEQARSLGANTLRIQVSQPGLDPQSQIFDASYVNEVLDSVRQARAAGFVVIISMQWEKPAGLPGQPTMPGDITLRAWSSIAKAFASDGDVMLELFNEPAMRENNPDAWPTWRQGMQAIVDELRAAGSQNVLILDGIHGSHLLAGAPSIRDPLHRLAYAVHPYLQDTGNDPHDWAYQWGDFAQTHPVVVSEWNTVSNLHCHQDAPETTRQLFDYMGERHIGVMVWALDLPGTVVDGSGQPLSFQNFTCGAPGGGAMSMASQYMKAVVR